MPPTITESGRHNAGFNPFARLSVGIGITLGANKAARTATASATQATTSNGNARLHYIVRDKNGNPVAEDYQYANSSTSSNWQQLQLGLRFKEGGAAGTVDLKDGGTIELRVETDGASGSDVYFDDVQIEQTGGMIVQEQHTYAYGSPLTDRNYVIGNKKYRHGYQGQFAERDEETGTEDFELRLYDSRIGRWTAPDPAGQYHSPYVGMSNNPVSAIDPDGGFSLFGLFATALPKFRPAFSAVVAASKEGIIGGLVTAVGIGAANTAVQAVQNPYGSLYPVGQQHLAYQKMIDYQNNEGHHEASAWLVYDETAKSYGVLLDLYPTVGDAESFKSKYDSRIHNGYFAYSADGKRGHILQVLGSVHTHPFRGDYYEGPSGPGNSAKGGSGDLGRFKSLNLYSVPGRTIEVFVINKTQVSRLDPNQSFLGPGNPHYIGDTKDLVKKGGLNLFNFVNTNIGK